MFMNIILADIDTMQGMVENLEDITSGNQNSEMKKKVFNG